MEVYENYIKVPLHYPKIASRVKSHLTIYPECSCRFWLPDGKKINVYDNILEISIDKSGDYVKAFKELNKHSQCSNCLTYVYESHLHDESSLEKEVFIFEYASHVLGLNHNLQRLELCECCYGEFKKDFMNLK